MTKKKKYKPSVIIKSFLLTVFVVMCICALGICTEYSAMKTRHRIDGSETVMITREDMEAFFADVMRKLYS